MKTNKVIQFNYEQLNQDANLYNYCRLADFNIRDVNHSKMKNYVTNFLCTVEELRPIEKYLFYFLYDIKAQQKYLPGLAISNKKLSELVGLSESQISRILKILAMYKIIYFGINKFSERTIIINEVINKWGVAINETKLSYIEEFRKHIASSNMQIAEEYKRYNRQSTLSPTN